jgi:hypothetical protein
MSVLDGGEWKLHAPDPGRNIGTRSIEGCVGRTGLDVVQKKNVLALLENEASFVGVSAHTLTTILTENIKSK